MAGTIDLSRKLLEMELRKELERLELDDEISDWLVPALLPFVENQIRLAKEGQR